MECVIPAILMDFQQNEAVAMLLTYILLDNSNFKPPYILFDFIAYDSNEVTRDSPYGMYYSS